MEKQELNIKQKKFADLYLASGNITQSYKDAYGVISDEIASASGNRLLGNVKVTDYIKQRQPIIQKKFDFTVDWLRDEVWKIVKNENTKDNDRLKGLDILGKTLGAYTTNTNVNGNLNIDYENKLKELEDKGEF